jgi:uncharacterized protein (TIGR03067 family)
MSKGPPHVTELITAVSPTLATLSTFTSYYRVFLDDYGPLGAQPSLSGRFALHDNLATGELGRSGVYLAQSISGAIWEEVFRDLHADAKGRVRVPPTAYEARSVATLQLQKPDRKVLRLDQPLRRDLVLPDAIGYRQWDALITTDNHSLTHGAAAEVNRFCLGQGVELPGLAWTSRQKQDELVYLLYEPPYDPADWQLVRQVSLSSSEGIQLMRRALALEGWTWVGAPTGAGFAPEEHAQKRPRPKTTKPAKKPTVLEADHDLAALQGVWEQIDHEADGVANPPDEYAVPGALTTFAGNRFIVRTPEGELLLEGLFTLDASLEPKAVYWVDKIGADAGKVLPASYRLEGDHFVFIAAHEGAARPRVFKTEMDQTMRTFVRRG